MFSNDSKVLLAVSGGIDSVCMAHLFSISGINCGITHCNFSLRGNESDADEQFVWKLAKKLKMPFYTIRFNTNTYAAQHGISIQMAARDLRYAWFEEIRRKEKYQCIAVAHHSDDEAETFFINLLRGTGISGLTGYAEKNNHIVRPLLFANRQQIEDFARKNKISYREDSSNFSDKYLRNNIRHNLIPLAKSINPAFGETLHKEMSRLADVEKIALEYVEQLKKTLIVSENNAIKISIHALKKEKGISFILFTLLKPYGFSGDIINMLIETLGNTEEKIFISETHKMIKSRSELCINKIKQKNIVEEFFIDESVTRITEPFTMTFRKCKKLTLNSDDRFASFDYSKLSFPLVLRKWRKGDSFVPLGMKGKKKLSDFFTDQKFSHSQKYETWLLCSGNDIAWVVGHRIDERYKISPKTIKIYKIEKK